MAPALARDQGIAALTSPDGRLGRQRAAVLEGVGRSRHLRVEAPSGALYAFVAAHTPGFDDERFAMELLERERVLGDLPDVSTALHDTPNGSDDPPVVTHAQASASGSHPGSV